MRRGNDNGHSLSPIFTTEEPPGLEKNEEQLQLLLLLLSSPVVQSRVQTFSTSGIVLYLSILDTFKSVSQSVTHSVTLFHQALPILLQELFGIDAGWSGGRR